MINFTKKQIKAIIDILKSEPCKTRPALQTMRIRRDGYGYITNGYLAIRFKFSLEPVPKDEKQEEFIIPLDNLVKWYKSADARKTLNELEILDLQDTENDTHYPNIEWLIEKRLSGEVPKTDIKVNSKLLSNILNITNKESLIQIHHYHECIHVMFPDDNIDAILMEIN